MTEEKNITLDEETNNAERNLGPHDKKWWPAVLIIVVFVFCGAYGLKRLKAASSEINALRTEIAALEKRLSDDGEKFITLSNDIHQEMRSAIGRVAFEAEQTSSDYRETVEAINLKKQKEMDARYEEYLARFKKEFPFNLGDIIVESISVRNSDNKEAVRICSAVGGSGCIDINNRNEENKLQLYSSAGNSGYIKLFSPQNEEFLTAGMYSDNGGPFLSLVHKKNDLVTLKSDSDGGYISLLNKNGKESLFMVSQENGDGYLKAKSHNGGNDKVIAP
jgi:hypothetical protein